MSFARRITAFVCCFVLLLSFSFPAHAEEPEDAQELLQQMLCFYHHHQTAAKTDIYRLLESLRTIDPEKADLWESIFNWWFYAEEELPWNKTELDSDLPDDDSLCIVVLGYALAANGSMRPELTGRLALALRAAEQYPNAYVLCTGGGTASDAPQKTEAGQMAQWLRNQGLDRERIIVEDNSTHTVQNAKYSIDLLISRYPGIRTLVIVSSDYHLTRSSTLFHARALHAAQETDTNPIAIAACLGYEAGHEGVAEDPLDQVAHVARVSGFEYRRGEAPSLSQLISLTVDAPPELEIGEALELTVTAHYDSGFSREVTGECRISGFDPSISRTQTVSITYAENGRQITTGVPVRRPVTETEAPTEPPTEETLPPAQPEKDAHSDPLWMIPVLLCAVVFAVFLLRKRK